MVHVWIIDSIAAIH